jgi:uncharacterized protein DUF3485
MNQIAAYVIAGAAILGVTIFDGLRWERWGARDPAELDRFVNQLSHVPLKVGEWDSEPAPYEEKQIAAAEIRGHYARVFRNRSTGATVNVFLVCGKTKPMIDHSPDQCYAAAGYKLQGEAHREPIAFSKSKGEFIRGHFSRPSALGTEHVEIHWGWTHDGDWTAPTAPRMTFANVGALYKLYVITTPDASHPGEKFLEEFLPILEKQLFRAPLSEPQRQGEEQVEASAA